MIPRHHGAIPGQEMALALSFSRAPRALAGVLAGGITLAAAGCGAQLWLWPGKPAMCC